MQIYFDILKKTQYRDVCVRAKKIHDERKKMIGMGRCLDAARVKHDANGSTKSIGRQVLSELGSDDSLGSVRSNNLSPDHSEVRVLLLRFGLENVSDLLSQIPVNIISGLQSLDVYQRRVVVVVSTVGSTSV